MCLGQQDGRRYRLKNRKGHLELIFLPALREAQWEMARSHVGGSDGPPWGVVWGQQLR